MFLMVILLKYVIFVTKITFMIIMMTFLDKNYKIINFKIILFKMTCWKGYERVPNTREYSKVLCRWAVNVEAWSII